MSSFAEQDHEAPAVPDCCAPGRAAFLGAALTEHTATGQTTDVDDD